MANIDLSLPDLYDDETSSITSDIYSDGTVQPMPLMKLGNTVWVHMQESDKRRIIDWNPRKDIFVPITKSTVIATCELTGQPVAVKSIRRKPDYSGTQVFLSLKREVEKLRKCIDHPAVVRFITAFLPNPTLGVEIRAEIVTEWCPRGNFGALLHRGLCTGSMIYKTLLGVSSALHFMHSNNMTYGHISLSNIVFDEQNNPRLCGFGIESLNEECDVKCFGKEILNSKISKTSFPDCINDIKRECMLYSSAYTVHTMLCTVWRVHRVEISQWLSMEEKEQQEVDEYIKLLKRHTYNNRMDCVYTRTKKLEEAYKSLSRIDSAWK